jgi:hypothetical protein
MCEKRFKKYAVYVGVGDVMQQGDGILKCVLSVWWL